MPLSGIRHWRKNECDGTAPDPGSIEPGGTPKGKRAEPRKPPELPDQLTRSLSRFPSCGPSTRTHRVPL